jgi:hypothetical protein
MSLPTTPYARPRLAWIKRRARRLQRFYGISRRLAIFDAWRDHIAFVGQPMSQQDAKASCVGLLVIQGGRHG